jgi:hypothetical protein
VIPRRYRVRRDPVVNLNSSAYPGTSWNKSGLSEGGIEPVGTVLDNIDESVFLEK